MLYLVVQNQTIEELDETNNETSRIVRPAGAPGPTEGHILVTGSLPSTVYTDALFSVVTGRAVYDVTVDSVRYTNYVVKGGAVEVTVRAEDGTERVYGGIHTDVDGNFTKSLLAPSVPGIYRLFMTVTDKTFVGTRELVFTAAERPVVEPPPPPAPTTTGTGYWTLQGGVWTWTWTSLPTSGPIPQSDVRVLSKDIYFSNDNPDAEEEITVFAEIHYWATSTALLAEDIPVNIYVTYPGTPKELIGQTTIPSLSVGAPEYGSRYVYATWKNTGEGIYIVEVEIDPSFLEENLLNNAATRAIIVGELASNQGAISGQVTDAWGGVANVIMSVFDTNSQLLGSTVTDATGFYLLESIPVGAWEVHIDTPAGYLADAQSRPADVVAQEVTKVDFQLTELVDTEPPVLSVPADITVAATGPSGALATYEATATDAQDGDLTPSCTPPSGSTFAVGTTVDTCTATDAAGNSASASFNVMVLDTTAPVVTVPADITVEATGPSGAVVTYEATATDAFDPGALSFQGYGLGSFLGDLGLVEALDFSLADLGGGTVNLAEVSLLEPDAASCIFCIPPYLDEIQPDTFVLATLDFLVDTLPPGTSTDVFIDTVYALGDGFGEPLSLDSTADAVIRNPAAVSVPEPATLTLVGFVMAGIGFQRRKRLMA